MGNSDEEEGEIAPEEPSGHDDHSGIEPGEAITQDDARQGKKRHSAQMYPPPRKYASNPVGRDRDSAQRGPGLPHPGHQSAQPAFRRDPSHGPRVMTSPRRTHKQAVRPRGDEDLGKQATKEEDEKEELCSMLRELTRYNQVSDAMRSLDTVCMDLKKAIKKLDKLIRAVKRKNEQEPTPAIPESDMFAKRIADGLKAVNVVINTSIGVTQPMDAVLALFKSAMNYRHDVFNADQKQALEGYVRTTKALKPLTEERDAAHTKSRGDQQALRDSRPTGEDIRPASDNGNNNEDEPGNKQDDRSSKHARQDADAGTSAAAPPPPPPTHAVPSDDFAAKSRDRYAARPATAVAAASMDVDDFDEDRPPGVDPTPPASPNPTKGDDTQAPAPPPLDPSLEPAGGDESAPPPPPPQLGGNVSDQAVQLHQDTKVSRQDGQQPGRLSRYTSTGQGSTGNKAKKAAEPKFRIVVGQTADGPRQGENGHTGDQQQQHASQADKAQGQQRHGDGCEEVAAGSGDINGGDRAHTARSFPSVFDVQGILQEQDQDDMELIELLEQRTGIPSQQKRPAPVGSPVASDGNAPKRSRSESGPGGRRGEEGTSSRRSDSSRRRDEGVSRDDSRTRGLDRRTSNDNDRDERDRLPHRDTGRMDERNMPLHMQRDRRPFMTDREPMYREPERERDGAPMRAMDRDLLMTRDERDRERVGMQEHGRMRQMDDMRDTRMRHDERRDMMHAPPRSTSRERRPLPDELMPHRSVSPGRRPMLHPDHPAFLARDVPFPGPARGPHYDRHDPDHPFGGRPGPIPMSRADHIHASRSSHDGSDHIPPPRHFPPDLDYPDELPSRVPGMNGHGPPRMMRRPSPGRPGSPVGRPGSPRAVHDERRPADRDREPAKVHKAPTEEVQKLLRQQRLVLIIDLDHTLVQSVRLSDLDKDTEALLAGRMSSEAADKPGCRELYRSERLGIWTKMRPGAWHFLAKASKQFELWAYSSSSRPYADAMADLLDPEALYFADRVIAAGSDGPGGAIDPLNARLRSELVRRGPITVAVDDRSTTWHQPLRLALLPVDRYCFFPGPAAAGCAGMDKRCLLELNRDECPEKGMLKTVWSNLDRLHNLLLLYYKSSSSQAAQQLLSGPAFESRLPAWDMRNMMHDERRKVLQGCCITFSRVIPTGTDPTCHALWRLAESYGATCRDKCCPDTTHVVSVSQGSEKTLWAAQHGVPVVSPAWLHCCAALWKMVPEKMFVLPLTSAATATAIGTRTDGEV